MRTKGESQAFMIFDVVGFPSVLGLARCWFESDRKKAHGSGPRYKSV